MRPLFKSLLTWIAVLGVVAVGFAVRYALVWGYFSSPAAVSPGICRPIAVGLQGPEDFAIDAPHNAIFVSATNRLGANPYSDANARDGLYLLKLNDPDAAPVKLAGTPMDFHPHGISLYSDTGGAETLMVIDDKPNGSHIIELYGIAFDGDTPTLSQQSAVQGGLLVSPNDLAAIAPDKFYVTNDHTTKGALGRFAEDYLLWPHADVMAFNGLGFRIAAQRMAFPNGILSKDNFLYVTATNERRLLAFNREDFTGNLTEIGSLSIPARLGNIAMDKAGNLIIAGQSRPGSAQVFRVHLDRNGIPESYETLFSDDGHTLRNASSAAVEGNQLFIGSSRDNKMLDCTLK